MRIVEIISARNFRVRPFHLHTYLRCLKTFLVPRVNKKSQKTQGFSDFDIAEIRFINAEQEEEMLVYICIKKFKYFVFEAEDLVYLLKSITHYPVSPT